MTLAISFYTGLMLAACATVSSAQTAPPSQIYPELFKDVQLKHLFTDSKTFADAVSLRDGPSIERDYLRQRAEPGFSLMGFVKQNFALPQADRAKPDTPRLQPHDRVSVGEHIRRLWGELARPPMPESQASGSLLPLPAPYVVPGGRFRELYYWDSYFTMLGLMADGRRDLGQGLVTNFAYQIDHYGHVPNGNRSYYLSRSQPPFFHLMVGLMAPTGANGAAPKPDDLAREYARYLAQLRREHAYWMDGAGRLAPGQAARHAVAMPDGAILNRYWDERDTPRDESYREDVETAARSSRPAAQVYRDLRAGAESGWDYSSRWLANGHDLHTIHTTDLIPIDLNSLLYGLEQAVSDGCRWAKDLPCMREFHTLAVRRRMAIERYLWDGQRGIYADLDWKKAQRQTQLTAATLMPLFMDIASPAKAASVARAVRAGLLGKYGLLTTPDESGQQWDAPNGWAPLQWMAIDGLRRHGQPQLASDIAKRWMNTVDLVYRETGKLTEKYNVVQQGKGGGGEYPGQDGFGWTNGVMARLLMMYPEAQTRTQAQTQAHQLPTKSSRTCGAPC